MTASQKPKTPSMSMRVRPGTSQEDINVFCKRASRLTLSQLVESASVAEQLQAKDDSRRMQYTVTLNLFPRKEYEAEHDVQPAEILQCFAVKFPLMLKKQITAEMKRLDADLKSQISQLGKGKKAKGDRGEPDAADEGEEEGANDTKRRRRDDEESEIGDGDADDEKRARQKKEQATYDDDDESESENEEIGEFGDEELEAELAEEARGDSKSRVSKAPSQGFQNQVRLVGSSFCLNFSQAQERSFNFSETQCSFQLDVSSLEICSTYHLPSLLVYVRYAQAAFGGNRRANMPLNNYSGDTWYHRLFPVQRREKG